MEAQDRLLELILTKQDETHAELVRFCQRFDAHVDDDKKLAEALSIQAREVWFVKRAFQATWGAVIGIGTLWLAWLGIKNG